MAVLPSTTEGWWRLLALHPTYRHDFGHLVELRERLVTALTREGAAYANRIIGAAQALIIDRVEDLPKARALQEQRWQRHWHSPGTEYRESDAAFGQFAHAHRMVRAAVGIPVPSVFSPHLRYPGSRLVGRQSAAWLDEDADDDAPRPEWQVSMKELLADTPLVIDARQPKERILEAVWEACLRMYLQPIRQQLGVSRPDRGPFHGKGKALTEGQHSQMVDEGQSWERRLAVAEYVFGINAQRRDRGRALARRFRHLYPDALDDEQTDEKIRKDMRAVRRAWALIYQSLLDVRQ